MPTPKIAQPTDPREQAVEIRPESEPWIVLRHEPRDGRQDALAHLALTQQRRDREAVIAACLEREGADLMRQQMIDTLDVRLLEPRMPGESLQDRRDEAAVAVRLHEPRWQMVSRYEAADAILMALRKSQRLHGWYLAESDLRKLADECAAVGWQARLRVLTGQITVTARTWAKAALGLLYITEDR